jgi:predicted transposase YbfD/YdcC
MRSAGKENLSILSCIVNEINNADNDGGKARVHIVSAYDVTHEVSLGQERVPEKSNEITADKALIESLSIGKGDLITMDAMGTQKEIAEAIFRKGADYLLIVKDNQLLLRKEIEEIVGWNMLKKRENRNDDVTIVDEKAHGYTVTRSCFTVQEKYMLGSMYRKWAGIKTFGVFNTIRKNKKTGEETKDTQYFITSLGKDAASLIMHKRNHWQVENGLHRMLDVEFREDDSKKKMNSAINYSIITKMVTAVLKRNEKKIPIGRKRLMAGWDENFMEKLILETINFLNIGD